MGEGGTHQKKYIARSRVHGHAGYWGEKVENDTLWMMANNKFNQSLWCSYWGIDLSTVLEIPKNWQSLAQVDFFSLWDGKAPTNLPKSAPENSHGKTCKKIPCREPPGPSSVWVPNGSYIKVVNWPSQMLNGAGIFTYVYPHNYRKKM